MPDDEFRISEEERERLVAEEVEEFPIEFPKYTTQLLNPANRFAQSTRDDVVGNMNELSKEFREKHPEGTFEDWVNFYFEEYDGEKRIKDATEKMYPMVEKMKEAFEQVDREMTQDFVRDLVLFKTYEGFDIQEVILRKLGDKFDAATRRATAEEEREGIDGYIGDQPVQVKPETYKDNLQDDIGVPIVYRDVNAGGGADPTGEPERGTRTYRFPAEETRLPDQLEREAEDEEQPDDATVRARLYAERESDRHPVFGTALVAIGEEPTVTPDAAQTGTGGAPTTASQDD